MFESGPRLVTIFLANSIVKTKKISYLCTAIRIKQDMKGIAILLGVLLISIIMIGLKFKFYSYIFGEDGVFGPENHSLSHEIKNLVKLRDQGLIDSAKYEDLKEELLRKYNGADKEIQKLDKLQKQGIITPEELEEIKAKLGSTDRKSR